MLIFQNTYNIAYEINKETNNNVYFITIEKYIIDNLSERDFNFYLNLPSDYHFVYTYYKNQLAKSIVIYKNFTYIPLVYLGLPNAKSNNFFQINYKFKSIKLPTETSKPLTLNPNIFP